MCLNPWLFYMSEILLVPLYLQTPFKTVILCLGMHINSQMCPSAQNDWEWQMNVFIYLKKNIESCGCQNAYRYLYHFHNSMTLILTSLWQPKVLAACLGLWAQWDWFTVKYGRVSFVGSIFEPCFQKVKQGWTY